MPDTESSAPSSTSSSAATVALKPFEKLKNKGKKTWASYLKKIENDPSRVEKTQAVKELIRKVGIPPEFRGQVSLSLLV